MTQRVHIVGLHTGNTQNEAFAETETGQCLPGVGGGDQGVAVDGKEASLWGDNNVLEVSSGDGCTTLRRYEMPLRCSV